MRIERLERSESTQNEVISEIQNEGTDYRKSVTEMLIKMNYNINSIDRKMNELNRQVNGYHEQVVQMKPTIEGCRFNVSDCILPNLGTTMFWLKEEKFSRINLSTKYFIYLSFYLWPFVLRFYFLLWWKWKANDQSIYVILRSVTEFKILSFSFAYGIGFIEAESYVLSVIH